VKFRFTAHALEQIERRGLERTTIERVLDSPGQIVPQRSGREAYQSKVHFDGREYLLRAIVDRSVDPPAVLTAYRTRFVAKYWRQE
jgi:hypothetical protein